MNASAMASYRSSSFTFEDSLTARVRGEQAQWARAHDAADEALQQAQGVVVRTRAEMTRSHGRTLLLTQPQQRHQPSAAQAQWRLLRDPLSSAAESAEGAASAAIEAVEASRQRWEADLTRARELAVRLEAAAQDVRRNLAVVGGASSEADSDSVASISREERVSFSPSSKRQQHAAAYDQAAAAVGLRESSSTEGSAGMASVNASTGSWEAAVSPAAARGAISRRQTLATSPHPALQTPLADRAASPHNPELFVAAERLDTARVRSPAVHALAAKIQAAARAQDQPSPLLGAELPSGMDRSPEEEDREEETEEEASAQRAHRQSEHGQSAVALEDLGSPNATIRAPSVAAAATASTGPTVLVDPNTGSVEVIVQGSPGSGGRYALQAPCLASHGYV